VAYEFQVTVDCADPHTLADWWAETLGWQVEPQDEDFIRRMIREGYADDGDTMLHNGKLVWTGGSAIRHPDGTERAPRVLFQVVPEPKSVKNRLHLDLRIGADDVEQVVAGLVARGAKVLHAGRQGPHTWVTVADPEGNELCVSQSASPAE
jgi:glyoxalase superfamily protein